MTGSALPRGRPGCLLLALSGLLGACGENEAPDDALSAIKPPEIARVMPASEALEGSHVPTLDPSTMHEAEVRKVVGNGPRCDFRYTAAGKPVLAMSRDANGSARAAVVKLNGHLVALHPAPGGVPEQGGKIAVLADPVRITVAPDAEGQAGGAREVQRRQANMVFEVGTRLKVGYRGYLDCSADPGALRVVRKR